MVRFLPAQHRLLRHGARLHAQLLRALPEPSQLLTLAVLAAVAIEMPAQVRFEELPRRTLPVLLDYSMAVAIGDVDGDGALDMVFGNFGQNRLYLNDGAGGYADATATHLPANSGGTAAVALGDFDGDGDLDLVAGTSGPGSPQTRLYVNAGNGVFVDVTSTQFPSAGMSTHAIGLGDLDGDGDMDLVLANYQQNRLYLNAGNGVFTDATVSRMPVDDDYSRSVVLGDVDGDGDLDVVFGTHSSSSPGVRQNRLYLNNGTATFVDATATQLPIGNDETMSVAMGDVDGDGDLDLVVGQTYWNYNTGVPNPDLLLNDGAGVFARAPISAYGEGIDDLTLGDVDGDGDLDLVAATNSDGMGCNGGCYGYAQVPILWLNDGAGGFGGGGGVGIAGSGRAVALADVDGDDDLDMVIANAYGGASGQNRLYFNLQRQLHAPTGPQVGQPYSLDAYMCCGTSNIANFALCYLSTAPAAIAMPPFGTLGIDLATAAPFAPLIVPQPIGVGGAGAMVPNQPSLVGQTIYSQAMLIAYPFDLRLSNVVADVIQ
tara:strand:- start:73683 stop:75314 length:1632 start_codon:yes stop_codon:yes gene_type:complete